MRFILKACVLCVARHVLRWQGNRCSSLPAHRTHLERLFCVLVAPAGWQCIAACARRPLLPDACPSSRCLNPLPPTSRPAPSTSTSRRGSPRRFPQHFEVKGILTSEMLRRAHARQSPSAVSTSQDRSLVRHPLTRRALNASFGFL